jgi:ElaB/YqjD/DUF883 family membrane-anchored ribosome-binding protein
MTKHKNAVKHPAKNGKAVLDRTVDTLSAADVPGWMKTTAHDLEDRAKDTARAVRKSVPKPARKRLRRAVAGVRRHPATTAATATGSGLLGAMVVAWLTSRGPAKR